MSGHDDREITVHQSGRDGQGRPVAHTRLTPRTDDRECAVLCEPDAVIPIVFLPGIMGTNLRLEGGGKVAWRPPNTDGVVSILSAIGTLVGFFFRGPATRQRLLDPDTTEVDDRGPIDTGGSLDRDEARRRGWGTLMRSAYHPAMSLLQQELNALMENAELLGEWRDDMLYRRAAADYGDGTGAEALTGDELRHAARYRFEVWAGGYNWLQSNDASGSKLASHIDEVVLQHYREELGSGVAERMKVVLVTHSMGGFVARALTGIHGNDKVLGSVLGVMPAVGAPATYKRMRSGFEGFANVVLGRNAAEVTAIMANSPGAMELLPTDEYGQGAGAHDYAWLKLGGAAGGRPWTHALPQSGDPYAEIYQSRDWYGLVPEHNQSLLDPAGLLPDAGEEVFSRSGGTDPFAMFDTRIDDVHAFHDNIRGHYPAPAYAHYGDDSKRKAWSEVHWDGAALPADGGPGQHLVLDDNGKERMRLQVDGATVRLDIAGPGGNGDETVPALSSRAPGLAGVEADFRQGDQGSGAHVDKNAKGKVTKGYEHQHSYNDPRALWATLYGIVKISQQADWA
ncbi:esterase/lipase family protein [Luteimonas sp. A501]